MTTLSDTTLSDVVAGPSAGGEAAPEVPGLLSRLVRKPLGMVALGWIVLVVLACSFASVLAPADPLDQDLTAIKQGPSAAHLLGTDALGRDVLSRLLHGGQPTLVGVAEAVVVAFVLGMLLGVPAGYAGGWTDRVITRVVDVLMSVPVIIVTLAVLGLFGTNMLAAMVTFGAVAAAGKIRVVRAVTLGTRNELYIDAARVAGLTHPRIIVRHVLPRIAGPVIVQVSLFAALALIVQTGLSFLGLLATPPAPTWGGSVADAAQVMVGDPWLVVPGGAIIALTALAFVLFGDAVRDATAERWSGGSQLAVRNRSASGAATAPVMADATEPDRAAALSVRGLTVCLREGERDIPVVRGVSFDVAPGETLGVVGESGCGKSLTILALLGLLPAGLRITGGSAWLAGERLPLDDDRAMQAFRGRRLAMIFQEPMMSLDPAFRVGSQLSEVVRRNTGLSRKDAKARAIELLRTVQLRDPESVFTRYPHELSGGMAQRIGIARALAGDPAVLLADEPTTALDVTIQQEILDLLERLQAERGMAIVLVTHDWGVVADACDRAIVLYAGQVVEGAQIDDVVERPQHPYTAGLLEANPHLAADHEPLRTIPGSVPAPRNWPVGCAFADRCRFAQDACRQAPIPLTTTEGHAHRCVRADELALRPLEVAR